ncbi:hypothetical protein [Streptomyces sp. 840.1]|uniref:hypothetical protein n=1 Tax=Streptomyces sp. 840.1 TaxID=2485152 RepID=UPI0011CD8956|nr:hypothetical protein [Streptomyces sp. 840.1]
MTALPGLGTASLPSEPHLTPAASYLPGLAVQGRAPTAAVLVQSSAAGEPISTFAGPNRFHAALPGGRLLPPAQLAAPLNTAEHRCGTG